MVKIKLKIAYSNSHTTTMDVSTFDGHLDYSSYLRDSQVFLDWIQSTNLYFNRYPFSEAEKVRYAIMKLIGQASQYLTDLKKDRKARTQRPIET